MQAEAQTKSTIAGEYELRGVMETASGLLLKPDGTFEFFFSYGAVDRGGSGKWEWNEKSNVIILNTTDRHDADYALVQSRKDTGKLTIMRVTDPNQMLLRYTQFRVHTANGIIEGETDANGYFSMPQQPVKKIELLFQLCPERFSTIPIADNALTYFEFRFEPWIADVYFNNVVMKQTEDGLEGGHPLLIGNQYKWHKHR